ncbi:dienelactone hydrolase [Colletotrichum higginsianum IMI 349063]|uniref:Dienelactone hydrolase n=3 Tax=Colletotrichum destructivum species complex TaxID=2707350 RepID=A0A1B7XXP0_COLHI|nr:dienelactone hydrolase [Colletotrichum higginsianum IMI 349063]OBR04515.1 dienelactone hydrolase [Colletotrichum higginsianum IMI 349063]TIC89762.1 Hydrolase tropI [Colletotrichum higginsianum]
MLSKSIVVALLGLASLVTAERKGPVADVPLIAHTGTPVGKEVSYNGLTQYVSKPKKWSAHGNKTTGVLYLTDVFGIQLDQNKLLTDSFARAGFVSVAPDLFNGNPAPNDINIPGFNTTQFLAQHGPNVTDPIVANSIRYLREELGVDRVAVTGYCFGGRYAFRVLADGKGADVGFAAHPSLLSDDEIKAITRPASVAAAETDNLMSPARRAEVEALLSQTGQPFTVALYSGTSHGFGVRANVSDPRQKFGKEEAFLQAVRFFDVWA